MRRTAPVRHRATDDRPRSVPEVEFHKDARDVGLHGRGADDHLGGNLSVGESAGKELKHLHLHAHVHTVSQLDTARVRHPV